VSKQNARTEGHVSRIAHIAGVLGRALKLFAGIHHRRTIRVIRPMAVSRSIYRRKRRRRKTDALEETARTLRSSLFLSFFPSNFFPCFLFVATKTRDKSRAGESTRSVRRKRAASSALIPLPPERRNRSVLIHPIVPSGPDIASSSPFSPFALACSSSLADPRETIGAKLHGRAARDRFHFSLKRVRQLPSVNTANHA